jgi:hypothetical protein
MLVVDWRNESAGSFGQVHLRDDMMLLARQSYRTRVNLLGFVLFGFWQFGRFRVYALVLSFPFDCVDALSKQAFHPFLKEQAGAIDEFVDHPCGKIVRQTIAYSGVTAFKIGCLRPAAHCWARLP